MITVDGRCPCHRCEERTKDIYRMVGRCLNCKTTDILIILRSGDPAADQDCPVCGGRSKVKCQRLATPDEAPVA